MTIYPNFPNKAHQSAYRNGIAAAKSGKCRLPPYEAGNRSSRHFRHAWLAGYDGALTAQAQEAAPINVNPINSKSIGAGGGSDE